MAEPLRITRSLDEITTRYTVFEENQVLTHDQLNDLADYLDDQDRLTRVALLGVGIVCGLRVARLDGAVVVTRGVGVTTQGDVLWLSADARFDRFKAYDKSAPVYLPFYRGEEMLPVFELVRAGEEDERAAPLGDLAGQTGARLEDMAALLLMESYVQDDDLCSGTDCDNLGRGSVHTSRVLLIGKQDLAALQENLPGLDQAARSLPTASMLAAAYRAVCGSAHEALVPALRALYPACESLLADLFAKDPAGEWVARLETLRGELSRSDAGSQYYYDFLKDVVDTYQSFRDLLYGEVAVCCPDLGAFPKHLLLGGLKGNDEKLRTGFYPSPLTSRTADRRAHARFLAGKLDTLLRTFKLPASAGPIRITPSRSEEHSLEERAIPFYYEVNESFPIYRSWSHELTRKGQERANYSFNADAYNPGAAARQLRRQIGRFDFFRIEGCLGHDVQRTVRILERDVGRHNLPIQIRAVALSNDRNRVTVKPPVRYTDLHRFHYLLRQDLAYQLEDTKLFSGSFKRQVDEAIAGKVILDRSEDTDGVAVGALVEQKNSAVSTGSTAAAAKLQRSYQEYAKDPSWKSDVTNTLTAAGELKANLGKVVKTEFVTPFDALIGNNQVRWLGWLDDIIKAKEDKEDETLLFGSFLQRHPGLEHFAGVVRGGTFVLVYDEEGVVVADFMLPYFCCDPVEVMAQEPAEPPLPRPVDKPPFILERGVSIFPSRERYIRDKLSSFRQQIEPDRREEIQIQRDYVDVFKESVRLMGTVYSGDPQRIVTDPKNLGLGRITDPLLDLQVRDIRLRLDRVDLLRMELIKPNVDPERQKMLETQLRDAEVALAVAAGETAQLVAGSKLDVKPGSEGFTAMAAVSDGLARLQHKDALEAARKGLAAASSRGGSPEMKGVIGNLLKNRGLGG
jgi:hypothetical protein